MESPFPERLPSYRSPHREMRCVGLARLSFEKRSIPTPYPFALSSSSPASTREDHLRDLDDDCFQAKTAPSHDDVAEDTLDRFLPSYLTCSICTRALGSRSRFVETSPQRNLWGSDSMQSRGGAFSRDPFPPGGPCSDEDRYWPSLFVRSRLHRGRFVTPVLSLENPRIEIVSSMAS